MRCLTGGNNRERREQFRRKLTDLDGIDPDDVILSPDRARSRGLDLDGLFPFREPGARGFGCEEHVYRSVGGGRGRRLPVARAGQGLHNGAWSHCGNQEQEVQAGDIVVLICRGPLGTGLEETYQITSALKHLPVGKHVAVITDARFSGVSTGACIGHVSPEALAGGPVGKLRDGDLIEITVDRNTLEGHVNFVGEDGESFDPEEGHRRLQRRTAREDLRPDPALPEDTRLWAALQQASGGIWGGCVYDAESIIRKLGVG